MKKMQIKYKHLSFNVLKTNRTKVKLALKLILYEVKMTAFS